MSHKCGDNCRRKQGIPGNRCETCKAGRHAGREANRLTTTIYLRRGGGAGQTGKPRFGSATIERFRRENVAAQIAAANGAGGECRHTWRRPANAPPDAIAFTCAKCGATQQL